MEEPCLHAMCCTQSALISHPSDFFKLHKKKNSMAMFTGLNNTWQTHSHIIRFKKMYIKWKPQISFLFGSITNLLITTTPWISSKKIGVFYGLVFTLGCHNARHEELYKTGYYDSPVKEASYYGFHDINDAEIPMNPKSDHYIIARISRTQ